MEETNEEKITDEIKESGEMTLSECGNSAKSNESSKENKSGGDEKLDEISAFINSISIELNLRNERDKYKDETINRISKENSDYQKDMLEKVKETLIKEILSFYNSFSIFQSKFSDSENQRLIKEIDDLEVELSNILFNNGIDEIEIIEGNELDRTYQKIKITIETGDIDKNNIVNKIYKKGFIWNDKVIQKQEVEIFTYKNESENE